MDVQQHLQSTPIKPLCGGGGAGEGGGGGMGCTEQLNSSVTGFRQEVLSLLQPCLRVTLYNHIARAAENIRAVFCKCVCVCVCRGVAGVDVAGGSILKLPHVALAEFPCLQIQTALAGYANYFPFPLESSGYILKGCACACARVCVCVCVCVRARACV